MASYTLHRVPSGWEARYVAIGMRIFPALPRLMTTFQELADCRATELLSDHTRVREASAAKGMRSTVQACVPADIVGTFVLLPA